MGVKVLSVGGSIINPGEIDARFLALFRLMVKEYLAKHPEAKVILVAGGGAPARVYQNALKEIDKASPDGIEIESGQLDWLGVAATRMNAQLLKELFREDCLDPVVTNPSEKVEFTGRVLVGSGWKPGFSSDFDAVLLADQFGADAVVNLSNIEKVYTDDPKQNPEAEPIDTISWPEFRKMVGDEWTPGMNLPFDPVASKKAEELGLKVICAAGKNIENTRRILEGEDFVGTTIGV